MDNDFYTCIGLAAAWIMKYIFIPFGVALSVRILGDRLLKPQPERQRKKRIYKNRLK